MYHLKNKKKSNELAEERSHEFHNFKKITLIIGYLRKKLKE